MKSRFVFLALLVSFFFSITSLSAAENNLITVMNPRGIQPEIRKIPMAPRPSTLDKKMVYIVDTKYPNTKPFVNELHTALKTEYPETNWVLKEKFGGYMDDDPELWKEVKAKAAGAIILVGH